jgi:hypothetical protein
MYQIRIMIGKDLKKIIAPKQFTTRKEADAAIKGLRKVIKEQRLLVTLHIDKIN